MQTVVHLLPDDPVARVRLFLGALNEPMRCSTSSAAASTSRDHDCRAEGGTRDRVIADFLVGAHALEQADRLLTRDRGYHRRYFAGLALLEP